MSFACSGAVTMATQRRENTNVLLRETPLLLTGLDVTALESLEPEGHTSMKSVEFHNSLTQNTETDSLMVHMVSLFSC